MGTARPMPRERGGAYGGMGGMGGGGFVDEGTYMEDEDYPQGDFDEEEMGPIAEGTYEDRGQFQDASLEMAGYKMK